MTLENAAVASSQGFAVQTADAKPQSAAKAGKGKKATKAKNARQKANQSNRKASRNFRLTPTAFKALRDDGGKGFINPYRESVAYHACTAALRKLGAGRLHPFEKIVPAVLAEMGEAAHAFKAKSK